MVFLFTVSQHATHADPYLDPANNPIVHCKGSDSHTHPAGGGPPICGGTLTYAINNFYEGANVFGVLLQTMVSIVVTAAFFYFFWNLVKYIRDEEDKEAAKTRMGYSLAAIFVIVTLWGIIGFVRGVLGINAGEVVDDLTLPTVGFSESSYYILTINDASIIDSNNPQQYVGKRMAGCRLSKGEKGLTRCENANECSQTFPGCIKSAGNKFKSYTGP